MLCIHTTSFLNLQWWDLWYCQYFRSQHLWVKSMRKSHQIHPASRKRRDLRTRDRQKQGQTQQPLGSARWHGCTSSTDAGGKEYSATPTTTRSAAVFLPTALPSGWIHVLTPITPTAAHTSAQPDHSTTRARYDCCTTTDGPTPSATFQGKSEPDKGPQEYHQYLICSPPLWVAFPYTMEKIKMDAPNGYKDVKKVSFYTGYNFRSVLLQRSSQDVVKLIQFPGWEPLTWQTDWGNYVCFLGHPKHSSSHWWTFLYTASNQARTS